MLASLRHPSVVSFYGLIEDPPCIVTGALLPPILQPTAYAFPPMSAVHELQALHLPFPSQPNHPGCSTLPA